MKLMTLITFLLFSSTLFFSGNVKADDISNYRFYLTDNANYNDKNSKAEFIAYIKKGDSCIYIKELPKNKTTRFCEITKDINLSDNVANIYPFDMRFSGPRLYFDVAAYWADQTCIIDLLDMKMTCELKHKPKPKKEIKAHYEKQRKEHEITVPLSVKHIEFKRLASSKGQYRLIVNNSEMNPCFIVEHYIGPLSNGPKATKYVCNVKTKDNEILDLIKADGSLWFENFKWLDNSLSTELSATGGNYKCNLPLPFTDKTEVLCTR